MLRFKQLLVAVLFVLIAGCSGGGCSTGCSCGGVTPLAEGFPTERRIENVASVRLTDSGISFLESNLGLLAGQLLGSDEGQGGILTFEIPTINQNIVVANAEVCKDGPKPNATPPECVAEIDLQNAQLQIDPSNPHNLVISGPLPIRIQKLPVLVTWFGFLDDNLDIVINGPGSCPGTGQPFKNVNINQVNISIEIDQDQTHSRYGYSRIRIGTIDINGDDILAGIEYCDQNGVTGDILDALDGLIIDLVEDMVVDTLTEELEEALCQQANPDLSPTCPTGTNDVDGICRYGTTADSECASIILGMDGNIDLGGFLASFSPGTTGGFDFLFAAGGHNLRDDQSGMFWGDLNPIGGGVTLGMYGGTEPTPLSGCVTPSDIALPTGIPIPDEITANTLDGWPASMEGPHFGVAVSERFMNYMLAQVYNSGALCLGITADALGGAIPLTTSLIGIGVGANSMNELGRQKQPADVAILIRPGEPPTIEVGNGTDIASDPLLRINWKRASFDFYVFSLDRFVRAFTATMDIDVPMNLMVGPDGLSPVIESLGVENATVTNSDKLIREEPEVIAAALQGLLGDLVGSFLGDALPPIDLNEQLSSLGITLQIPESTDAGSPGLRKLVKGSDDFLGIFATLGLASPSMATSAVVAETRAELSRFDVDAAGLAIATWTPDNGPRATIRVGSDLDDGTRAVEYQYKLDKGPWHPFRRDRVIVVDDHWLRAQGKHTVYVRSRVVGDPMSLDRTPAEIMLIVDAEAPTVRVSQSREGEVRIEARDAVSGQAGTLVRMRLSRDGQYGEWSEWMRADELPAMLLDGVDEIEVEAMDEDGNVGVAQSALLRGRGEGGDCECSAGPKPSDTPLSAWLALALGGALVALRRRRPSRRSLARAEQAARALSLLLLAGLWAGCNCGDDVSGKKATGCKARGDCVLIEPGIVGAYTSAAVAADGTVWVAGYLEGNWRDDYSFGDLVAGKLEDGRVAWEVVDGAPTDEEVDCNVYDCEGFRKGVTGSGDDVGLWTSIQVEGGQPAVAYYDASHKALKYASYDGKAWSAVTVQGRDGDDLGRYAKLRFIGGKPTIAYLYRERGDGGAIVSGVRIATGSGAAASADGWSFEEVASNPDSACNGTLCPAGYFCALDTRRCVEQLTSCSDCDGQVCGDIGGGATCLDEIGATATETYPDAYGLYVSLDVGPDGQPGVAFYDRMGGNVVVAKKTDGAWSTIVADGDAGGTDTGDKGVGLSLDIDEAGDYHIAYVNGLSEALEYQKIVGGTTPGTPETVDDGLSAGDGVHLVGDDSHIVVSAGGEVRISYQDATAGVLRYAVGPGSWQSRELSQDGFAGAFSRQLDLGGGTQIVNWWRLAAPDGHADVGVVTP